MKYDFLELKDDLTIGHEVEFLYMKNKYSISNNAEGCYLTKYGEEEYQSFNDYEELLENAVIDNKTLEEIWDDVIVEWVF